MKNTFRIVLSITSVLFIFSCAAKQAEYDLPSVEAVEEPVWLETPIETRDTVFIVLNLPAPANNDLTQAVQKAQSELHSLLGREVEVILRDYWLEKQPDYSEDRKFELLSKLPITLEKIMNHVHVEDAWEREGQLVVLCGFDNAEVLDIVTADMGIKDSSFPPHFKTRIDRFAQTHQ